MKFNQEEFNKFVVDNNVFGFFKDSIILKSGRETYFYANWRDVSGDVFLLDKLSDFVINFVEDLKIELNCFYGVPEGATKLGVITQYKWAKQSKEFGYGSHTLPMGRKKPKDHGDQKDKFFVGSPKGKIVVLEDVTTTGNSLVDTILMLFRCGFDIVAAIGLTNRMEKRDNGESVKKAIEKMNVPYYQLSSAISLLPFVSKKLNPTKNILKKVEQEFKEYGVERLKLL